ncbi:PHP domain-containing protein [Halorarum halobium]|uniref:PHP domain-containing protein n=1 Tax=Halorarum halobium TaxID=3075121 RepID=UPI0028A6201B|nr:PHP domain-containing protein [Halobaculum sp. XH14]
MNGDPGRETVRIDCHVHTADSYDSTAPVEEVLRHAARVGIDGLVVTDHDRIERSLRAAERAAEFGLIGIPGVEVSTADGHLLAIGVETRPEPGRPLPATVEAVRDRGGVAVVPHPFQLSRHGASAAAITDCDGIETFNAHGLTGIRNRQAARFADAFDYPRFGGSDAHRPRLVGCGLTRVEVTAPRVTPATVLDGMCAGRTRAAGNRTSVRRYLGKWARNARLKRPGLPRL